MENWMYAIATGVTGAAVIKLIDNIVQWKLQRKAAKEDRNEENDKKELQKTVFKKQVEIAKDANLPFVIHSREASGDMVNIVTESDKAGLLQNGFLMHCYSESKECAEIYLK